MFIYRKCRKIIKIVFNYLDRQITAIKGRVVLPLEKLLEKVNELIGQILSKPNMKNTDETYLSKRTIKPLYHCSL